MKEPQRLGSVIQIKAECIEEYCHLHANTWPEVLKQNRDSNLKNYTIFMRRFPDNNHYLFSFVEYWGDDFETDMKQMAENEIVFKWWNICKPMHIPFENRAEGEWWATMKPVFFQE